MSCHHKLTKVLTQDLGLPPAVWWPRSSWCATYCCFSLMNFRCSYLQYGTHFSSRKVGKPETQTKLKAEERNTEELSTAWPHLPQKQLSGRLSKRAMHMLNERKFHRSYNTAPILSGLSHLSGNGLECGLKVCKWPLCRFACCVGMTGMWKSLVPRSVGSQSGEDCGPSQGRGIDIRSDRHLSKSLKANL